MNISLTAELETLIKRQMASGMYHSASEVIREALQLLKERDAMKQIHFKELKNDIAIGLRQARRGESRPLDIDAIRKEIRKRALKKRKPS